MTDAGLLEVRDVSVELRGREGVARALDHVSFSVDRGETIALLGESGSGKSMTALAIMGLIPEKAGGIVGGRILLEGADLRTLAPDRMRDLRGDRLALVPQDPLSSLNPVMTVGRQIGEMLRRHTGASRRAARAAALELMQRVNIPDAARRLDDFPHQFSGGMRQRVLIAMAIALKPALLIADEPTTALDVTVQAQIMRLLRDLQRDERMGLILVSHDLGVVADTADRVVVMYGGRVVESGPLEQVYRTSAHPYTQGLLASVPRAHSAGGRLTPIGGAPPSLFALPSGCAFHPRCARAQDVCGSDTPVRRYLDDRQSSACHFAEQVRETPLEVAR